MTGTATASAGLAFGPAMRMLAQLALRRRFAPMPSDAERSRGQGAHAVIYSHASGT